MRMSNIRYTNELYESLFDCDLCDVYDALKKYQGDETYFRSFKDGLILAIYRAGYEGLDDDESYKDFIRKRLKEIGSNISNPTIRGWFQGVRSDSHSRDKMYQLCFAFHFGLEDTKWFFEHVYYERCFYVKALKECIYYYCMNHHLSYQDALRLIDQYTPILEEDISPCEQYSDVLRDELHEIEDEETLKNYLYERRHVFQIHHVRAAQVLHELVQLIQIKKEELSFIKEYRINNGIPYDRIKDASLLLQDLLTQQEPEIFREDTKSKYYRYTSEEFMLHMITTCNRKDFKQITPLLKQFDPLFIRNFIDVNHFSRVINQPYHHSDDSIRKVIILLSFYRKAISDQLAEIQYRDDQSQFYAYCYDMNDTLSRSDLPPLFIGHPYDWFFLFCACHYDPLDNFRCFFSELKADASEL